MKGIYDRAVLGAPQVDRRIVRAVDRVLAALPVPHGVFGREDVWQALQANAKEAKVPLDLDTQRLGKGLDALWVAGILTFRGGAYSVREAKPEAAKEPAAKPVAAPVVEVVEEAAEPVPVVEVPVMEAEPPKAEPEPPKAPKARRQRSALKAAAEAGALPPQNQAVLDLLAAGPRTTADICAAMGETSSATRCRLHRLMETGLILQVAKVKTKDREAMTVWGLPSALGTPEVPSQPAAVEAPAPAGPAAPDLVPLLSQLERFAASSVDAATNAEALAARVQGALRYIAEIEGEGELYSSLCHGVHRELDAAGVPHEGTPAERVRWLRGKTLADAAPIAGPAWPSLHSLDLDAAEEVLVAIERRLAAWWELLRAAREVAA